MPSLPHEGIITLIREKPDFAADLLREILHGEVPSFTEARLAEASLNELIPAEYTADAVVLFVEDRAVFGSIFEAQLREDARKRFTWRVTQPAPALLSGPILLKVAPQSPTEANTSSAISHQEGATARRTNINARIQKPTTRIPGSYLF